MPQVFYPLAACQKQASERRTVYANSTIHLFKQGFSPTASDPLSAYTAEEADYDTYAAITLTAWDDPILAPGSGFLINSPLVQFEVGGSDPVVGNVIAGAWLEDSANAIRMAVIFDEALPMQAAFQGIPINLTDLFPTLFTG